LQEELGAGNAKGAVTVLEQMLAIEEEQPTALLTLGKLRLQIGQFERAMEPLRLFQSLEPAEAIGYHLLGRALMLNGRSDEALVQFKQSVERQPDAYMSLARMAWILATHPDPALLNPTEAIRLAQAADENSLQHDPVVLQTLAAAYAADGQFDQATTVAQSAIDAIVNDADTRLPYLRIQLQAYQNAQSLSDGSLMPQR